MNVPKRCFSALKMGFAAALMSVLASTSAWAIATPPSIPLGTGIQCPNDIDNMPYGWGLKPTDIGYTTTPGPEDVDWNGDTLFNRKTSPVGSIEGPNPNAVCIRIGATDGYVKMADGSNLFTFGFVDLTGVPEADIINYKFMATLPAPEIEASEGQELYLTISTLGLLVRPDLPDPHTVHFHGYRQAVAAFDGVPDLSMAVPPASNFTYYYKLNDPGTYGYHCHVEPTEHIAMGMVGTIIVKPAQDTPTSSFAYNDGGFPPDTSYNRSYTMHMHDLDGTVHYNLETVQEVQTKWFKFKANYFTFNGRNYPETLLPAGNHTVGNPMLNNAVKYKENYIGQPTSALVTGRVGERILLRLNNLTFQSHSLTIPGIPMHVVGKDARLLRGPDGAGGAPGKDISFRRTAVSVSGGEEMEVILDTAGLASGTYFLYGRELYTQASLSLTDRAAGIGAEIRNGLITEIRLAP